MNTQQIIDALPKLLDGETCYPGLLIERDYLGSRWEAVIVSVEQSTISVNYRNAGSHKAQFATARLANPQDWRAQNK